MAGNSDLPFVTDLDGDNTRHRQAASTIIMLLVYWIGFDVYNCSHRNSQANKHNGQWAG